MKIYLLLSFIMLFHFSAYSQIIVDSMIQSKSKSLFKKEYKAPGVIIEEIPVQNQSVAEVESAIPAFIGYTQIAKKSKNNDLILKPTRIKSMLEYEQYFGLPFEYRTSISVSDNGSGSFILDSYIEPDVKYILYYSVKMFFDNGGGTCYIVAVGTYSQNPDIILSGSSLKNGPNKYGLKDGLEILEKEDEPALIVIPESIKLQKNDYQKLVQLVLSQCGKLADRFGIFDLYDGNIPPGSINLTANREYFGLNNLKYGAVYYPFLKSQYNFYLNATESNIDIVYNGSTINLGSIRNTNPLLYNFVKKNYYEHYIILPPGGAIAGAYANTDKTRGVWKAPANIALKSVKEPLLKISDSQQESMNVDAAAGKSINVVRTFTGKGTVIWGSRTLAGNDNEWRYIPVRRFFTMVEESVKKSTEWVVFEPNNANTWTKVRSMIENYLTIKWREGALMGSKPQDAFFVKCGLGQTMTNQDILEGNLNVEIGMAVVRPAEFIILKFSHKMQNP